MINEIKDHFILVDKCAEQTRIVEIESNKIVKVTFWQDDKPPLIGNILDATVLKKLNSGIVRASLNNKKIITEKLLAEYGESSNIEFLKDPSIMGGLSIKIGDETLNLTIRGKVKKLVNQLNF